MDLRDYKNSTIFREKYWWFIGKRDFIDHLLQRFFGPPNKRRILDVGCGVGDDLGIISRYGEVVVLDSSDETLKYIPDKYHKIRCELSDFTGDAAGFDGVVLFDVLEHLEDDREALEKVNQILLPNGIMVILVPAFSWLWSPHDEYLGHFRRYSRSSLLCLVKGSGFKVIGSGYWNSLLFPPIAAFRLLKRSLEKKVPQGTSDLFELPRLVNYILAQILHVENSLHRLGISFPFGSSVYMVLQKS